MTLEQILDLARQARRSPDARRVLHDALLERYGDVYETAVLGDALDCARTTDQYIVIALDPRALAEVEADFAGRPIPWHTLRLRAFNVSLLENWRVIGGLRKRRAIAFMPHGVSELRERANDLRPLQMIMVVGPPRGRRGRP